MKRPGLWFLFLITFILLAECVEGKEVQLPPELNTKAFVKAAEKDALWEKTLVLLFEGERRAFSTNEGFLKVKAAINHSAHPEIWKKVCEELKTKEKAGGIVYIEKIKRDLATSLGLKPEEVAELATAANIDNLAIVTKEFAPYLVTALVTAGAKTNALRTGVDEGSYMENKEQGPGTVNTIILTNALLTDGAMARAVITATEAKTAAFQDLNVPSSYTKGIQATGTGTDSIIVVSAKEGPKVKYTGGHSKIGELIGKAVYEAVCLGLERQNGFKKAK